MVGMQCPSQVSVALEAYGWKGRAGYWFHPMHGKEGWRWWEAYCLVRSTPQPRRCKKTVDMFKE